MLGSKLLLLLLSLLCVVSVSLATCQTKSYSLLDSEEMRVKTCPGPGDPDSFTDCCGPSWQRSVQSPQGFQAISHLCWDSGKRLSAISIEP